MQNIPRAVYFKNGICVGVGTGAELSEHNQELTFALPTDHYDFAGPLANTLRGKTLREVIDILYQPKEFFTADEMSAMGGTFKNVGGDVWTRATT